MSMSMLVMIPAGNALMPALATDYHCRLLRDNFCNRWTPRVEHWNRNSLLQEWYGTRTVTHALIKAQA